MNKKALAILGVIFILIVGTLGYLIYAKYGKKSSTTAPSSTPQATSTPVTSSNPTDIPPVSTSTPSIGGKIVKIASEQVVTPVLCFQPANPQDKKCDVVYFDNQGYLYQAFFSQDSSGNLQLDQKKTINIPLRASISRILWPNPDSNNNVTSDFIAEFNFGGHKTWSYFNSKTVTWTDLPPQIEAADWLPGGQKIMYIWLDANGKATINTANPDSTGWQYLADMYEADDALSVSPDGRNVLFYRQQNSGAGNGINMTTTDAKLWKGLVKDGYNYGVLWSPDGTKFLFGKKDPSTQKYQLWVYDVYKQTVNSLGVFTLPSKAVWTKDGSAVYAAVPYSGSADEVSLTSDDFYRIDVSSFDKKQYPAGGQSIDGRNLFLNGDGTKLLFKNAQDGGLYYLDLNQ